MRRAGWVIGSVEDGYEFNTLMDQEARVLQVGSRKNLVMQSLIVSYLNHIDSPGMEHIAMLTGTGSGKKACSRNRGPIFDIAEAILQSQASCRIHVTFQIVRQERQQPTFPQQCNGKALRSWGITWTKCHLQHLEMSLQCLGLDEPHGLQRV